jgi:circadian clock protein KaiC
VTKHAALAPLAFDRISTGITALDEILGGGIPKNSINIIMGHPGTGKTILAEQLVFRNASGDRPILYFTTLSEPLSKVITYLQGFSFYEADKLYNGVVYEDIGADLAAHGPQFIVDRLREAIRDIGPKIIVIDSFKVVHDLTDSPSAMRRAISDIAGLLSAYDTTTFLIGEYSEQQIQHLPEFAVADGIIELARRGREKRDERFIRVFKMRGSTYAEGLHAFRIGPDGLDVYPRLVTPKIPIRYDFGPERVGTGVPGLDKLFGGGMWRGSTALVTGAAGTGKTTLALQFAIAGVLAGQKSLYLNFQENPTQLARTIASMGHDVDDLQRRGLVLRYESPVEMRIDSTVMDVFRLVREQSIQRVAIDAVGDLALAAGDPERFHDYLYSLCQHMIVNGATTLMTLEVPPDGLNVAHDARFSSMADVLIDLRLDVTGDPVRTLRIAKARSIAHDLGIHTMTIDARGISINGASEPAT